MLDQATIDSPWELRGGSPAMLQELAEMFIGDAPADIAGLREAVATADLPGAGGRHTG